MEKFFGFKKNNTSVGTEIMAGMTTFFAMSYIVFVNPAMLSKTGMPFGAVFLATIIATVVGTLVMGLFANVPYAQAPCMGLNAFFTYTVCGMLGFTWQQGLSMVFLCGVINIIITVTKLRKSIIKAIPISLQHAIGGGIGIFIAYIGIKNAGLLNFTLDPGTYIVSGETIIGNASAVPSLVNFNSAGVLLGVIGLVLTIVLLMFKVKGAILISIIATTIIGIPMKVVDLSAISSAYNIGDSFKELGITFGAVFGPQGMITLFNDIDKIPLVLMTIFAFSLSDTFDTIGTFIGTGRKAGIFSDEEQRMMSESKGFKSKMDKALFADSIATSVGAIFGTSNVSTYVESAAGISVGGRTGFTSVITALLFILCIFIAPFAQVIPTQATSSALIVVGIMMLSSFKEIDWNDLAEAVPAFFAGIFMALCYNISYGIATAFIFYCIVKICKKQVKEISPILFVATILFILNFIILGLI